MCLQVVLAEERVNLRSLGQVGRVPRLVSPCLRSACLIAETTQGSAHERYHELFMYHQRETKALNCRCSNLNAQPDVPIVRICIVTAMPHVMVVRALAGASYASTWLETSDPDSSTGSDQSSALPSWLGRLSKRRRRATHLREPSVIKPPPDCRSLATNGASATTRPPIGCQCSR